MCHFERSTAESRNPPGNCIGLSFRTQIPPLRDAAPRSGRNDNVPALAFARIVLVQGRADDLCSKGVPVGGVQRFSVVQLKMGRQCQHEQAIYRRDGKRGGLVRIVAGAAERSKLFYRGSRSTHVLVHIDTQSQVAQQEQCLL